MEDPGLDWEMEEEYEEISSSGGKMSWILNKGLVFGKKVLMTGMLITSAPFVLPPLMAISAFGVAASVPSGLFLASYACSEKVMSSLLPGSSPLTGYYFEDQLCGEEGDINVGLFEQDIDMEKEEQQQIDDTKGRVEMRIELPDQVDASDETLKEKNDHEIETEHEKGKNDEFGRNEIPVEEVRDVVVMESGGDETTPRLIEKFRNDKNVDEGRKQGIMNEAAEEMDMPIEAKSAAAAGKKSGGKIKKGKKKGKVNEQQLIPKQIDDDSVKVDEATVSTPQTHQGKGDNNGGEKATVKKIHHSGRLSTDHEIRSPAGLKGVGSPRSKKEGVVDSEEDIKKQIEAMKAIVGYKGTPKPHASCMEELKALYIFTGVEPPESSFKDDLSDIEELSHKLKFLMSIVGVK